MSTATVVPRSAPPADEPDAVRPPRTAWRRAADASCAAARRVGAWAGRHRRPLTVIGTLVTVGALAVVLSGRWGRFAAVAVGASPWLLGGAVVLHVMSLVARSEAWNLSVRGAGGTVSRRRVYRAASAGYVGNIINGELGFALRIAALRRSAPADTPRVLTLAATELPIVIVEVTLATLTAFTLVAPLGLPWWTPVAGFGAMLALTAVLGRMARKKPTGWRRGLAILGDGRGRLRLAGFVVLAVCGQIARNWMMLKAAGIHASVFDATAVLIAVAVLGVLPVGPSVGAGAAVLILGAQGVAGVSAAGVLLTATATLGALAYAIWALLDRRWSTTKLTASAQPRHHHLRLPRPARPTSFRTAPADAAGGRPLDALDASLPPNG